MTNIEKRADFEIVRPTTTAIMDTARRVQDCSSAGQKETTQVDSVICPALKLSGAGAGRRKGGKRLLKKIIILVLITTIALAGGIGIFLYQQHRTQKFQQEIARKEYQYRIQQGQLYKQYLLLDNIKVDKYTDPSLSVFISGTIRNIGGETVECIYLTGKLIDDEGVPFLEDRGIAFLEQERKKDSSFLKPGYMNKFIFYFDDPPLPSNWTRQNYSVNIDTILLVK